MSIWGAAIKAATTATAAAAAKKKNSSSSLSSSKRGSSSSSSGSSSSWLDQAKANSSAWHTADAATKKNLEQANQKLYSDHGYTYNSKTGTWSAPTTSSSGGSYSGGSSSGGGGGGSSSSSKPSTTQAGTGQLAGMAYCGCGNEKEPRGKEPCALYGAWLQLRQQDRHVESTDGGKRCGKYHRKHARRRTEHGTECDAAGKG